MLKELKELETDGLFRKVIWLTAKDEAVCPLCAAREGKHYSFENARKELDGVFCDPPDPDDRCRCCFIVDDSCLG
jgi:hypothetical protein